MFRRFLIPRIVHRRRGQQAVMGFQHILHRKAALGFGRPPFPSVRSRHKLPYDLRSVGHTSSNQVSPSCSRVPMISFRPHCLRGFVRPHHPGKRVHIRDRHRPVAQQRRLPHQFIRMRGPAQKRKIARHIKFGIRLNRRMQHRHRHPRHAMNFGYGNSG